MYSPLTISSAVLSFLLAACLTPPPRADANAAQRSQPLLGTFVTITAYGPDRELLQRAISDAFEAIRGIDRLLSVHRPDSEVSLLNKAAGKAPVPVSPELYDSLEKAQAISRATHGAFDVTIGPIAQLWGFIWKEYRLPKPAELAPLLPLVSYANLLLFPEERKAQLLKPGMFLDFGGIGKGMAVDAAIAALERRGVRNAMVKAGGDLRAIGAPPGRESWEVQIEDPARQGRRSTIRLPAGALSTSGNYENFFVVDGQRYSHIIDPRTGLPLQGIASCTVTARTCTESDALATAFFVLGIERALQEFGGQYGIRFISSEFQAFESNRFKQEQLRRK